MSKPRALVVDDEPDIRELLEITLQRMGVDTEPAADLVTARELARQGRFDLCLTDMRLPDGSGIELVRFIQQHSPQVPVAVITAHGSMETAIEALKNGAFDFVSKPVDLAVLRKLVQTALRLAVRIAPSRRRLVGDSEVMENLRATIAKLARSQAPVFITGESGTGKELVARMIHEQGARAEAPFVPVNCGAMPDELMESELFGHRKGSFTGATADSQGLFQAADGGTLFLDEVADLPLHMQVKLLRAIQEKAVRPVGAQKEVPVDVRILSASHGDLGAMLRSGRFRQDLYYRLHVIELRVPALRERPEDIAQLAEYVLERLCGQTGTARPALTAPALAALRAYQFPGNVRELENLLERAMTLCEGEDIDVDDLGLSPSPATEAPVTAAEPRLDSMLENVEKERILAALEKSRWNKTAAARLLGLNFGALRYRMQKLGIE